MMIVTISEKGGQQSQYDFGTAAITIGRMKGNDIVLPKGNVSKKHSRISVVDGNLFIADMNSTNGTYVNGRKVTGEQAITENDKIYIGDFILQVQVARAGAPPPAPPPAPRPRLSSAGGAPPEAHAAGQGGYGFGMTPVPEAARPPMPPGAPEGALGAAVDDLFSAEDLQPRRGRPPKNTIQDASLRFDQFDAPQEGAFDDGFQGTTPQPYSPSDSGSAGLSRPVGSGPLPFGEPEDFPAADMTIGPEFQVHDGGNPYFVEDAAAGFAPVEGAPAQPQEYAPQVRAPRRPLSTPREVRSTFDYEFHAAQHDVARVLFERVAVDELSLEYPPQPELLESLAQQVSAALETVSPAVDHEALREMLTAEMAGLGPIELYLDDPQVQDIYIQRYDQILVRKDGELVVAERAFSHPELLLLAAHRLLGTREPAVFADEVRFGDGTRVHLVMPPVAVDGPAITLRKPPLERPSLEELVEQDVLSDGMREFLERVVQAGQSVLIAGPTSAGKTTLLEALGQLIAPGTRVITVEEAAHLDLELASAVRLEANPRAGFDLRALVRTAVSMHPQRILLDECRGAEAYEWISSAASGTEGSMMTIQGISTTSALEHLESLCLLASPEISPRGLREQIARAVDFVVVLNRRDDRGYMVRQISELQGVDLDAFRFNDVFYHRIEGNEEQFHPTGYIPLFYEDLRHAGIDVDFDVFRD